MRIAIVGLGGVGGYLAAYLDKTENDVVGFARGSHLNAIQKHGIKIKEDTNTFIQNVDAKELDNADGYFDIVLFCVKSYDLMTSYEAISSCIDSRTIILSFSNGVNNANILKDISSSIVVESCIYILSHIEQNGVIRKNGDIFAAILGGNESSCNILKSVFESANLRVRIPSDIRKALYKKYIFISAFACLTAYYDESIVQVCESHILEVKMVLQEIADVAFAQGIDIMDEVQKSIEIAKSLPYDSSTSMHLDYKQGKKMELESLCGYVVKEGDRHLVDTHYMKKIYSASVR